jgi:malate synthase
MTKVTLLGPPGARYDEILTAEALDFVADLVRAFGDRRTELLDLRTDVQARLDSGWRPDRLAQTAAIRDAEWQVAPIPDDLLDRRVEITGPVERKMIINALNSGAQVFMADFEDSNSPTWANVVEGQINLFDAARATISYFHPDKEVTYELNDTTATLMVRPRGWHLVERHAQVDGEPVPASLFDFGLFFFHNAAALMERGSGPYFYLPKLENHLEARLWNDVFVHAQKALGIPVGTIRATVLIETITAAFEMEEILYELREHSAGLNCGRWDYIFSFIKKFRNDPAFLMPDRAQVGMTQPCMHAYTQLVIKTCHRRGAHAIGGMAAQIPIKSDPARSEIALEKVRKDKLREVLDGHDGTWVAHPGLVPIAREVFDKHMPTPNQVSRQRDDVAFDAEQLLAVPTGTQTLDGVRLNIRVGVQYLEAWLGGNGCVPLYDLMEDAATAEISRTQVWQQLRHQAVMDDGAPLTVDRFRDLIAEVREADALDGGRFDAAFKLFDALCTAETFVEFLTLPAYELLED